MKVVELKEKESKFTVNILSKNSTWDKEFVIYQWYNSKIDNYESKLKIIIDIKVLTFKFVKVEKTRTSKTTSDKKVSYLNFDDFKNIDLIGIPFVMKRRSIKGNYHLDRFIYANSPEKYLLEIEDELEINSEVLKEIEIIEDVSTNPQYLNINMAIDFNISHYQELSKLINIFQ